MTGGSYFMPAMPVQPNQFMPRPGQMIRATPRWGNQPVSCIFKNSRVSDQELKVYFRCQWQISDPECQWVNHLKVNIMCFYKKVVIFCFSPWRTTTVQVNKYGA